MRALAPVFGRSALPFATPPFAWRGMAVGRARTPSACHLKKAKAKSKAARRPRPQNANLRPFEPQRRRVAADPWPQRDALLAAAKRRKKASQAATNGGTSPSPQALAEDHNRAAGCSACENRILKLENNNEWCAMEKPSWPQLVVSLKEL